MSKKLSLLVVLVCAVVATPVRAEGSVTAPSDVTSKIVNPDGSDGTNGWTVNTDSKSMSATMGEHWSGATAKYFEIADLTNETATAGSASMQQTVTGLENGVYRLTAAGRSSERTTVRMYAGDDYFAFQPLGNTGGNIDEDGGTTGSSMTASGVGRGWTYGRVIARVTDGTLTIGTTITANEALPYQFGDISDFKLEYLGSEADYDKWQLDSLLTIAKALSTTDESLSSAIATAEGLTTVTESDLNDLIDAMIDFEQAKSDKTDANEKITFQKTVGSGDEALSYEATYVLKGKNLVRNGSFEYGFRGWNGGTSEQITSENFTLRGFEAAKEGKQYLVGSVNAENNAPGALAQEWSIEAGKSYILRYYVKSDNHYSNNSTESLKVYLTDFNTAEENLMIAATGTLEETNGEWNEVTVEFENTDYTYCMIDFSLLDNQYGFDNFMLYEADEELINLDELKGEIATANALSTGGNEDEENATPATFKIPYQVVSALKTALDEANALISKAETSGDESLTEDEIHNAAVNLQNAVLAYKSTLNAPAEGQRFKIKLRNAVNGDFAEQVNGKPMTFYTGGVNEGYGDYGLNFDMEDKEYYGQAFSFTASDAKVNGYTISFTDQEGNERYLCLMASYGGRNYASICTTTDAAQAYVFQVVANTGIEGSWKLYNSDYADYVGNAGNGYGVYTSGVNCELEFVEAEEVSATYNFAHGYATALLPFAQEVPQNMTAYTCETLGETNLEGVSELKLVEVADGKMAANTPYILEYVEGTTYTFQGFGTYYGTDTTVSGGLLVGSMEGMQVEEGNYVLQNHEETGFAFYPVGSETKPQLSAYHCFLQNAGGSVKAIINFPGSESLETAVSSVPAMEKKADEAVYDLSGRRVARPQSGIYIKGGRKVVIK